MSQIILDAGLAHKLVQSTCPVELCDPAGKVLGRFVPLIDLSQWEPISPDVAEDELDRRSRSAGRHYTTAEVIGHLEGL